MTDFVRWFRRGIPLFSIMLQGLAVFGLSLLIALAALLADMLLLTYTSMPPEHIIRSMVVGCTKGLPVISAGLGLVVMIAWAGLRVSTFHPFVNRSYLAWLRMNPWQPGDPLPLGPLGVTTQDCVVIVVVSLLLYFFAPVAIYVVPMVFLAAYCLAALCVLARAGQKPHAYAVAFGLGIPIGLLAWPWASFAALVALYGIARRGLERSLDNFPWEPEEEAMVAGQGKRGIELRLHSASKTPLLSSCQGPKVAALVSELGWPLQVLRYRWQRPALSRADAVLLALLPGYHIVLLYVMWLTRFPGDAGSDSFSFFSLLFCFYAAFGRLINYIRGCAPPISFLGRIFTGRIIIPRYDVVFVTPLLALFAAIAAAAWAGSHGFGDTLTAACTITVFLLVILNGGPSLSKWRLTGAYRASPGLLKNQRGVVKL